MSPQEFTESSGMDFSHLCECCETCQESACQGTAAGMCEAICECNDLVQEPKTCQRCQNRRLIEREPGATLADDRPDLIVCPRCLGAGPVAERPPGVPRATLKSEMVEALEAVQMRTVLAAGMVC